ncbi:MAG: STAS domain-containing protein [Candidatus Hydrogenedentes bacterium]|nr:STAS domain-containing protein [Candidatus Hydrogenedentota bacterium]
MLNIETLKADGIAIVRVDGEVDEDGVRQLRIALVNCLRNNGYNVVVNLSGMKFISYMGVGVLVERLRQFRSYDGDMKLVGLNLYTQRLFRMTGVTSLFDVYENEADAIRDYQEAA